MTAQLAKQIILVVDDSPENIDILSGMLDQDFIIKVALNGERALKIARGDTPPDLILLDIMMPDIDGYEVCRRLKESKLTKNIPVIFITAKNEITDETKGFEIGAVDYIIKPLSAPVVKVRVNTHLALYDQSRALEKKVIERTKELMLTQDATIHSMAILAETRDNETGSHIMRTQHYVRILAEHLEHHSKFREYLDQETIVLLFKSAPLHDIGKVGIPDSILLKPGKLTDTEFEEMKKHTVYGYDAILKAEEIMEGSQHVSFLRYAKEIAATHHEKWDGSGYPYGLTGEDIPISGRLMIIADIYDALISKRVYKQPFSHAKAVQIITQGDGRVMPEHFDPHVLEAFLKINEQFHQIALAYTEIE
jgi:putative two-component system response regulator